MTRYTPLSVAAGFFAAMALPLKAGSAAETEQAVDTWLGQHQSSLTLALDKKLEDQAISNVIARARSVVIEPIIIRVSTEPVKRITAGSAI